MMLRALLFLSLLPCVAHAQLVAYRVGRAETIAHGPIEHAVILVDGAKIVAIGEDLPIERGIRVVDLPGCTAMPGLVLVDTRLGLDGQAGGGSHAEVRASDELYPQADEYEDVRELGVTTLGLSPAGGGIPGRGVAIKPRGDTREAMILRDPAYLKVEIERSKSSKKAFKDGFEKADKHQEKVEKAREKWEKDQEKKKSKGKKADEKKDEKKEEGKAPSAAEEEEKKKEEESSDTFTPPAADEDVQVFLDLRAKKYGALVTVAGAAEYLHFVDALDDEDIDWTLRIPLGGMSDVYYVLDKDEYGLDVDGIGDKKARVLVESRITLQPGTMRERNLPAELVAAGAKLALVPTDGAIRGGITDWRNDVGRLVAKGLAREDALRAMTLAPAEVLGVAERVGSLEEGKDADLLFLDGDPFEATTKVRAVLIDGELVHGEVAP